MYSLNAIFGEQTHHNLWPHSPATLAVPVSALGRTNVESISRLCIL